MRVIHKLSCKRSRRSRAHSEHYVIQTSFKERKHVFARNAFHAVRHFIIFSELTFLHAVNSLRLLLFAKLQPVFGNFLSVCAVLTGSNGTFIERALVHIAFIPFKE